jgi:hypothetical protein
MPRFSILRRQVVWAAFFSLGLCLVYCLFYSASYLGVSFFVLSDRGMIQQTVGGALISPFWDGVVWGVCLFVVLAWLLYDVASGIIRELYKRSLSVILLVGLLGLAGLIGIVVAGLVSLFYLVLASIFVFLACFVFCNDVFDGLSRVSLLLRVGFGAVLVGLVVELGALFLFSAPIALNLGLGAAGLHFGFVELAFSNLAYPSLLYVYLLFVLFGVVAFVIRALPEGWLAGRSDWSMRFDASLSNLLWFGGNGMFGFLRRRFVLVLAIVISSVVSCLFVVLTVLPWANPTGMLVSVDSPRYYEWISHMRSVDINSALSFAFGNDRALFLLLAYAMSYLVTTVSVVQFVAAMLIVLFGIVTFFVLRLFSKIQDVWVFGVLLVPFSFQALGLIYSGYFANMLALILVFVYAILFFKVLKHWSILGFFGLLAVSVLILFSHSWTWFIFALSLLVFLFLEWRLTASKTDPSSQFKLKAIFVGATLGVGAFCDLSRLFLSPVSSTASILDTAQSSLGLPNLGYLLSGMQDSVEFVLGGVYANGLLIFLCFIGFLVLLKFKSGISNFFIAWIFISCISILFAAEGFVFDRFLFLVPWVLLSSLGLFWCVRFVGNHSGGWKSWRVFALVALLVVFLLLFNGSLRFLLNINVW